MFFIHRKETAVTELIIRLFIKNGSDLKNPAIRVKLGMLAAAAGIATNLLLFLVKLLSGFITGSISIIADAFNNLSDFGASSILLVSYKISEKPADAEHPYGHGRMEYIAGLIVSFVILLLGVQLFLSSVGKILHPEAVRFGVLSLSLLALSIPLKLWQSVFYKKIGQKIDSLAFTTASADSRNDVLSTLSVIAAALISHFTGFILDGFIGAAVALFIFINGIRLVRDTINPLLGLEPKKELVRYIQEKVMAYENIIGIHDLHVHSYGPAKCYASLHCEVPADQDIMLSHDIADNIERDFLLEKGIHLVIHLDPVVTNDEKTTRLREEIEKLVGNISPDISIHDFRAVWSLSHVKIIFDMLVPYKFRLKDKELHEAVCREICALDASYSPVIVIDHY